MTLSANATKSVILTTEPQLFVCDIELACRFYADRLGFEIAFQYGEPPFYAQVVRDGGRLNLRRISGPVFDPGFRDREQDALSATFTLDDARAFPLFSESRKRSNSLF